MNLIDEIPALTLTNTHKQYVNEFIYYVNGLHSIYESRRKLNHNWNFKHLHSTIGRGVPSMKLSLSLSFTRAHAVNEDLFYIVHSISSDAHTRARSHTNCVYLRYTI